MVVKYYHLYFYLYIINLIWGVRNEQIFVSCTNNKFSILYSSKKNEEEAKIKVQKELNKLNHQLLLDMPLTRINVIEINDLDIKLESSENKIISILNENLR